MDGCLLCLETNNDLLGSIKVNSERWKEMEIEYLIEQHLWHMEAIQSSSWLCSTCWQELYDFHKFYTHIEEVQNNRIEPIVKIEYESEKNLKDEKRSHDLNLVEQKLLIKKEQDMYLSEDDIPLIQINKKTREDPLILPKNPKEPKTKIKSKRKESNKKSLRKDKPTDAQLIEKHQQIKSNKNSLESITEESLNDESNTDSNSITNTKTDSNFKLNSKEKDKFIAEHFKIICSICETPLDTFGTLLQHFQDEHKERGYVKCCNKKFFQRIFLLEHIQYHLDPSYLTCRHCGRVMANRQCLSLHVQLHEQKPEKTHCCDICGLRFTSALSLQCHKDTRHLTEEEKLFACPECPKNFGNKWQLSNHINGSHVPPVSCEICGLLVANKNILKRHKKVIHPPGGMQQVTCPICSKVSKNQQSYNTHVKDVHQSGYNHKCTVCSKAFKKLRKLKDHMASHTGVYMYKCSWCPKVFRNSNTMHQHRRKKHPLECQEENSKKYSQNLNPTNDDEKSTPINVPKSQ